MMSQFWWQAALKLGMMSRSQHTVRFGRGYDEPDLVAGALKLGMMSRLSAHCAIWERR